MTAVEVKSAATVHKDDFRGLALLAEKLGRAFKAGTLLDGHGLRPCAARERWDRMSEQRRRRLLGLLGRLGHPGRGFEIEESLLAP